MGFSGDQPIVPYQIGQLHQQSSNGPVEILLKNLDSRQALRASSTPNFSTHFVVEKAPYVAPLSDFPEEDEMLFPPMSRFLIREVEKIFPRNPDKVTLVYLSPGNAGQRRFSHETASRAAANPLVSSPGFAPGLFTRNPPREARCVALGSTDSLPLLFALWNSTVNSGIPLLGLLHCLPCPRGRLRASVPDL